MKMPPKEKIYEAYSAIADHRVTMNDHSATVLSSTHEKTYQLKWDDTTYVSNDSASYWQGYPGYPIIAVWMLQGILPYSEETAQHFASVPWNDLNKQYKRDYVAVVQMLLEKLKEDQVNTTAIVDEVEKIYEAIAKLPYSISKKL